MYILSIPREIEFKYYCVFLPDCVCQFSYSTKEVFNLLSFSPQDKPLFIIKTLYFGYIGI